MKDMVLYHKMNLIVGKLEGNEKGFGFLIPDDKEKRRYIYSS